MRTISSIILLLGLSGQAFATQADFEGGGELIQVNRNTQVYTLQARGMKIVDEGKHILNVDGTISFRDPKVELPDGQILPIYTGSENAEGLCALADMAPQRRTLTEEEAKWKSDIVYKSVPSQNREPVLYLSRDGSFSRAEDLTDWVKTTGSPYSILSAVTCVLRDN